MKTYTEEQLADRILEAVTKSKIQDALALTYYAGSQLDAAKQILRDACIRRSEVDAMLENQPERERLYPLLG